ncbi:MAG: 3-isopropylmalate dehydrogenase [Candidatus Acidiferrales bacterium]
MDAPTPTKPSGVRKTVAVLPGDGVGPEVTRAAVVLLTDCAAVFGHQFVFRELPFGGNAIDSAGAPLPADTLAGCLSADAVLLGAIGGPQWDKLPLEKRPEAGLLGLRKALNLYINLRPIRIRPALRGISPLRAERLGNCDFEIIRELAGDIYFGKHERRGEGSNASASDVAEYSVAEIERVARYAFERAEARRGKLTSVDKANILATSTLWRQTVTALGRKYPTIELDHLYVDNAAMQLLLRPDQFDVILTGNMFGDILSDEAAALAGSIGLIPSMSRGRDGEPALYEPIHGSAPSLAGKDVACPLGAIFSASLMLRESFGMETEAQWIEAGVDRVLDHGYRTMDIAGPDARVVRCSEFTELVRGEVHDALTHTERYGWGV